MMKLKAHECAREALSECARDTIRGRAGFTFIELMLAAGIFAVVAVAVYSVFNTGISAWKKAQDAQNLYQDVRLALDRMACDLENATLYSKKQGFINFEGKENEISFYSLVDVYQPIAIPAHPELKKITYSLNESRHVLQRLEQSFAASKDEEQVQTAEEIAAKISNLKFSYCYDRPNLDPPYEWKDNWDFTGSEKAIPQGVIIELGLEAEEKATFSKYVFIPTGKKGPK